MAKNHELYIEKRESGRYALERPNAKRAIGLFPTQAKAIERAKQIDPGFKPHIARVRHVEGKGPDKFRKV